MAYKYDLHDFKRFLNDRNASYRVDGLVFWQNRIPLPVDLFNRMFGEADLFLSLYLDHIVAALIAQGHTRQLLGGRIGFDALPGKEVQAMRGPVARGFGEIIASDSKYAHTAAALAGLLGIDDYRPSGSRLATAICHQGKKYSRLYLPERFREIIGKSHRVAAQVIGCDNTDMFGNVIADHYDIYRSGFSDALSIIFNLLVEFRLLCGGVSSSIQRVALEIEEGPEGIAVEVKKTSDGSLWEPDYGDDHVLRLNPEHPYFRAMVTDGQTRYLNELLSALARFEYGQFSDTQRKLLENMRQEVSRDLWIRYDQ